MARKRQSAMTDEERIALAGIDYCNKKEAIKTLDGECKELRKPLESYLKENGKTLSSGSIVSAIPYADMDVILRKTLRVGKSLLPEAIDVLKENGLEECIENVPTIREDVIESLYLKGKISDDVLQKIYTEKTSYAFSVNLKHRVGDEDV